jgi:hypothetical protein
MPPDEEIRVSGSELELDEEKGLPEVRGVCFDVAKSRKRWYILVFFRVQSAQIPALGKVRRIPGISCFIANYINTCERT